MSSAFKVPGNFAHEADTAAEFDRRVSLIGPDILTSHSEVSGHYLSCRPDREQKACRIDRLLMPGPKLIERGWCNPIGIELKRSGEKIGRPIAQAIDYTWAVFDLNGTWVYPEWIFIWPCERITGPLESVMVQNRIGTGRLSDHYLLDLRIDVRRAVTVARHTLELEAMDASGIGRKRGAR